MMTAITQIVIGAIILAGIFAGMSEYPEDNFFRGIPPCLFLSTSFFLAAKVFLFVKRSLSKRFKFSTVMKGAGIILAIVLAHLYLIALGIITSKIWPNLNRNTKYDNKFVILDVTNPRDPQFKLYDKASKFVSAVNSKEAHLKDWLLVFTSPNQEIETVGAISFINFWLTDDEKKMEIYDTIASYEADTLFKKGYICSTFPDAKSTDDIFDSVLNVLRKITKQKERQ